MVDLDSAAVTSLEQLVRIDPDPRVRWRAQSLVVLTHSRTLREGARLTGGDPRTLSRWRDRFVANGRTCLADRPRVGRPAKLPADARTALTTVLEDLPTKHGYATATWILADLQDLLTRKGWEVAVTTVSRTLHSLGYVYHRPKHDRQHRQDADRVATAAQTLRILQQKGGLTAHESAWSTVMSATCTPIRTWQTAGNDVDSVGISLRPASTSAAPSTAPSSTSPVNFAGNTQTTPALTESSASSRRLPNAGQATS